MDCKIRLHKGSVCGLYPWKHIGAVYTELYIYIYFSPRKVTYIFLKWLFPLSCVYILPWRTVTEYKILLIVSVQSPDRIDKVYSIEAKMSVFWELLTYINQFVNAMWYSKCITDHEYMCQVVLWTECFHYCSVHVIGYICEYIIWLITAYIYYW